MLDGYRSPVFYDMKDYTDKVLERITDAGTRENLQNQLDQMYDRLVVSHCCTPTLYSFLYDIPKNITINSNCGLTISAPTHNSEAIRYFSKSEWYR